MILASLRFPPARHTVTRKLGGIATGSNIHVPFVFGNVVHAMRDDFSVAVAGKVMVQNGDGLARVELAIPVEVTQQLLFPRVDADDRRPRCQILLLECGNALELRIAIRMLLERLLFCDWRRTNL